MPTTQATGIFCPKSTLSSFFMAFSSLRKRSVFVLMPYSFIMRLNKEPGSVRKAVTGMPCILIKGMWAKNSPLASPKAMGSDSSMP